MNDEILNWLLSGDPSIRWQAERDLLHVSVKKMEEDRKRIAKEGWGAKLLALQEPNGHWGGGMYTPKWTSTTYSMLTLRLLGLPPNNKQARLACKLFLDEGFYSDGGINFFSYSMKYSETCVTAMILSLLAYFKYPDDRVHAIASFLIGQQMPDGGWNCESPATTGKRSSIWAFLKRPRTLLIRGAASSTPVERGCLWPHCPRSKRLDTVPPGVTRLLR